MLKFGDPESIAIARKAERQARRSKPRPNEAKIGKMHQAYGVSAGNRCKGCIHLVRNSPGQNSYMKCELYGISNGPATDWRSGFEACGKFKQAL